MSFDIMSMFDQVKNLWMTNQFLSGAGTIAIIGGLIAYGRTMPMKVAGWVKNRFIITVTVEETNYNPVFRYVNKWFSDNERFQRRTKDFMVTANLVESENADLDSFYKTHPQLKSLLKGSGKYVPTLVFSPGIGRHFLFYKRRLIMVSRKRIQQGNGNSNTGSQADLKQSYVFDIFSRDRTILDHLFNDMVANDYMKNNNVTNINIHSKDGWRELSRRKPRSVESVILQDNLAEEIYNDMKDFFEKEEWYRDKGVPYRRGYCFYGEPGTGKSSIVLAMAGALNCDIAMLNLNDYAINDNNLAQILTLAPAPIILLEDIDAVFKKRKKPGPFKNKESNGIQVDGLGSSSERQAGLPSDESSEDSGMGLSFSGFINALDGVAAQEGKVVIMTTNHIEKLDEAMIRPGRVDRKFYIGRANKDQMRRMFLRFFPEAIEESNQFAELLPEHVINMATLQEHMMQFRHCPLEAVSKANILLKQVNNASIVELNKNQKAG